jgi:stage II sporulation protein D
VGADHGVVVRAAGQGDRPLARATFLAGPAGVELVETGERVQVVTVRPAQPGEALDVDGARYRGLVEARAAGRKLTVVNHVHLEDYLRGVVPNELSPAAFPELEALKAQAVAARTYALKHLGQFEARGYDLCATAACQVYRGRDTEHELSDRAVAETRGLVALHGAALIDALYTSTCGGHTEDAENVFAERGAPYLRGVACIPEGRARKVVATARPWRPRARGGLGRDLALLHALGVLGESEEGDWEAPATPAELGRWTGRLRDVARRGECGAEAVPSGLGTRAAFFRHVVGSLCWHERAQTLPAGGDAAYLVAGPDREALGAAAPAVTLLVHEGLLRPEDGGRLRPQDPPRRFEAVALLAATAERLEPPAWMGAGFVDAADGELIARRAGGPERWPLDPAAAFSRRLDGRPLEVPELLLTVGDPLRIVVQAGRIVFLEVDHSRHGSAADQGSRYYRWEVRLTPEEVARGVSRFGDAGEVRDLLVRRRGVSRRVAELEVQGSRGNLTLRGLDIRRALGVRENLFVVERELAEDGGVARFIIAGKGWGHGVGLCQVGAYGMARAGSSFEDILRHYYTGVEVRSAP